MDILNAPTKAPVLAGLALPRTGAAASDAVDEAAEQLKRAKRPVMLLGMLASKPDVAAQIRALVETTGEGAPGTRQHEGDLGGAARGGKRWDILAGVRRSHVEHEAIRNVVAEPEAGNVFGRPSGRGPLHRYPGTSCLAWSLAVK